MRKVGAERRNTEGYLSFVRPSKTDDVSDILHQREISCTLGTDCIQVCEDNRDLNENSIIRNISKKLIFITRSLHKYKPAKLRRRELCKMERARMFHHDIT